MDKLFLCLYIQNELNLRLLPVNYICCEDAMNAFISSSLGSSIIYFRTKMLGSNPAVAYFTIVSPFSVQSSFEAEAVSHFQFQWLVNKFTSNTIFNIKTKCARNRDFMHILFVSSSLKFQLNRRQAQWLASKFQPSFFIIKVGFSGKSRKRAILSRFLRSSSFIVKEHCLFLRLSGGKHACSPPFLNHSS